MGATVTAAVLIYRENFIDNFLAAFGKLLNLIAGEHVSNNYKTIAMKQPNGFLDVSRGNNLQSFDAVVVA
ncbi:MAG: hypothetical protein NXH95_08615 [Pseudomonadaceae bacterium]|nr:hypothetical protein [Pseudomonadaceae bacterium]